MWGLRKWGRKWVEKERKSNQIGSEFFVWVSSGVLCMSLHTPPPHHSSLPLYPCLPSSTYVLQLFLVFYLSLPEAILNIFYFNSAYLFGKTVSPFSIPYSLIFPLCFLSILFPCPHVDKLIIFPLSIPLSPSSSVVCICVSKRQHSFLAAG